MEWEKLMQEYGQAAVELEIAQNKYVGLKKQVSEFLTQQAIDKKAELANVPKDKL